MVLESLSDRLQGIFKNLKKKGKLSEEDVKAATKEIKMVLLEADVNFKVVKDFIKYINERAVGVEVLNGINPSQMVVKIVKEELVKLFGSEDATLTINRKGISTIMMVGLQGAGKTTTAAKIAGKLKNKGKKVLLVALDVYRPAAIEQLKVNGKKQNIEVYEEGLKNPVEIAKNAYNYALSKNFDVVIFDTAGRLQIDDNLMNELSDIKNEIKMDNTVLVIDSMVGQESVNVASTFDEKIGISGVVFTKLDGDTRGGAILSIKAVTNKPILYIGVGEKLSDLEEFHPERMANRILGMGDVLSLIEKAEQEIDNEKALEMSKKISKKEDFDFNDYLTAMEQMNKMGGMMSILSMLPGVNSASLSEIEGNIDEKKIKHTEAIVYSMTPEERMHPKMLTPTRKRRIANGCGLDISEVNRFVKQFEQMQKMMKQMPKIMNNKKGLFKNFGLF